jgi:ribosomal protein S18 acetylase RimI-like enzyme
MNGQQRETIIQCMEHPRTDKDAETLIQIHPHAAFDRVLGAGYRIEFRVGPDEYMPDETRLDVKVLKGSVRIATANVTDSDSGTYCQNVEVARAHQRRGIATAMYVLAELIFQKTLLRYWTADQHSSAADAFWAQPNRPFGGTQKET